MQSNTAYAIKLGNRYFVRFGKGGRVLTAWSLAGARLMLPHTHGMVARLLTDKGKKFEHVKIGEVQP